jgi:hypothetical protein
MKDGQKLKLGDAHVTPRNIQEVQASKLGDAQGTSFFINKNIRSSFKTLFLWLHMLCVVLGASLFLFSVFSFLLFCFQFSFVLFAIINFWITSYLF